MIAELGNTKSMEVRNFLKGEKKSLRYFSRISSHAIAALVSRKKLNNFVASQNMVEVVSGHVQSFGVEQSAVIVKRLSLVRLSFSR